MSSLVIETDLGYLTLFGCGEYITGVRFGNSGSGSLNKADAVLITAAEEIREFLAGSRKSFSVPVMIQGATEFHTACLEAMKRIPYGSFVTYGELAAMAGYPGAFRAAGSACRRNPVPVIIPCHRVLAAGGRAGGYNGGIQIKKKLLQLEGIPFRE